MVPLLAGGLVAGASALGGLLGNIFSSGDRQKALDAENQALQEIQSTGAPPDLAKAILLKHFQSAGVLTPQLAQAVQQQASQLGNYQEDPSVKAAQMQALSLMQQRGQTGLSPEDRAAFNQVQNQVAQDTQGKVQQIMQNMQARGQGGSGAELAAALNASSQGQQQASQQGDQLAGLSSQRALEALVASGQLGGQISAQQFGQAAQKASAQDAINRFNAANAQNINTYNTGAANQAQQYNLQNQQNIMNQNAAMDNAEQLRQLQAQRQYWQDKLGYNQALANAYTNQANVYNNQAAQTSNLWQGLGQGVSQGVAAGYGYQQQQDQMNQNAANNKAWQNLYSQQYGLGQGTPSATTDYSNYYQGPQQDVSNYTGQDNSAYSNYA